MIYFRVIDREGITEVEISCGDPSTGPDFAAKRTRQVELATSFPTGQDQRDLQALLDQQTEPWGIKVSMVVIKNVDLPLEMQRAMAKQAEAERERRAKVINALGEQQAAEKLSEAAHVMGTHPVAIQLRYLQTLAVVAAENNSTTLFPVPIDLFKPFVEALKPAVAGGTPKTDTDTPEGRGQEAG